MDTCILLGNGSVHMSALSIHIQRGHTEGNSITFPKQNIKINKFLSFILLLIRT